MRKGDILMNLSTKILIGLGLGIIAGLELGAEGVDFAKTWIGPFGTIFMNMIKMIIVPLVFSSLVIGVCSLGDIKKIGRIGGKTMAYYLGTTAFAIVLGIFLGTVLEPGAGVNMPGEGVKAAAKAAPPIMQVIIDIFPTNAMEAMLKANMLQIIVFCLFLGVALLALGDKAKTVIRFIDEGSEVMLKITEYVIEFSPFGILSLIATMVSTISGAMMKEVLVFLITDNVICLLILILVYPLIIKLLAKLPPFGFMRKIAPPILVAVSTSSSAATLPVSIKISEEDLGIPENIYGFTLPLGNTAGMTGFAVFIGLCCVFASNLYGFPVTFSSVLQFVFFGLILSIGAAGVKGAGVVMSGVLLEALGMPLTLIPILAAIWPVIDPAHTTLNNVGDLVGTTVVARSLDRMDMDVYNNAK